MAKKREDKICLICESEEERHITPVGQPQNIQNVVVITVYFDKTPAKPLAVTVRQAIPSAKQTIWRSGCVICGGIGLTLLALLLMCIFMKLLFIILQPIALGLY